MKFGTRRNKSMLILNMRSALELMTLNTQK